MQQFNINGTTVVVLKQPPQTYNKQERYKKMGNRFSQALIGLGSIQLIIGVLCIVFQIVSVVISIVVQNWFYMRMFSFSFVGHGIWHGCLFFVTGIFGILSGKRKNRCSVIAFNVLSIISASLSISILTIAIISAIVMDDYHDDYFNKQYYQTSPPSNSQIVMAEMRAVVSMECLLASFGFIEGLIAVVSSSICCAVGCCNGDDICCHCCHCPRAPAATPCLLSEEQIQMLRQMITGQQASTAASLSPEPLDVLPNQTGYALLSLEEAPQGSYTILQPSRNTLDISDYRERHNNTSPYAEYI